MGEWMNDPPPPFSPGVSEEPGPGAQASKVSSGQQEKTPHPMLWASISVNICSHARVGGTGSSHVAELVLSLEDHGGCPPWVRMMLLRSGNREFSFLLH